MEKFAKYIGVPGLLALMTTTAMIAWVSFGIQVPDVVYALVGAAWSFYFAVNGKAINSDIRSRK